MQPRVVIALEAKTDMTEPTLQDIYSNWARDAWRTSKSKVRGFIRTKPGFVVAIAAALIIPAIGAAIYVGVKAVEDYQKQSQAQRNLEDRQRQQKVNLELYIQEMGQQERRIKESCAHLYDANDRAVFSGSPYTDCRNAVIKRYPVPYRDVGINNRIEVAR